MILAAGEGRRMRPLTETTPKPLLRVRGAALIEHHLHRLRDAGVTDVIINVSYLGGHIEDALGGGDQFGVQIHYSREPQPLETAGALVHAAQALGSQPFLLINSDVYTDYPLERLISRRLTGFGHLVFVPNPPFKGHGDYSLDDQGRVTALTDAGVTFAGLSVLTPELVASYPAVASCLPLRPVFDWAVSQRGLTGELYRGAWSDVGTPERLAELNR